MVLLLYSTAFFSDIENSVWLTEEGLFNHYFVCRSSLSQWKTWTLLVQIPAILLCFFNIFLIQYSLWWVISFILPHYFCPLLSLQILCPRGGLTLKTQHVLNHELMSSMKEYLTQGRLIKDLKLLLTINLQHSRKYLPHPKKIMGLPKSQIQMLPWICKAISIFWNTVAFNL